MIHLIDKAILFSFDTEKNTYTCISHKPLKSLTKKVGVKYNTKTPEVKF